MTKKNLIYVNDREVRNTLRKIETGENNLNKFFRNVQKTVGNLPKENLEKFPTNAPELIRDELQSRFQFKNAEDDFNLQALGINPEPLYKEFERHKETWTMYVWEFDGECFKSAKEQPEIEKWYTYADTKEKQDIIKTAETILSQFKIMKELNLVVSFMDFKNAFNINLFTHDGKDILLNRKRLPELFYNLEKRRTNKKIVK